MSIRIDIVTCLPGMFSDFLSYSIIRRAVISEKVSIYVNDLRDYALNRHKKVDDHAYGGGAGMVMTIEPIDRCITALKSQRDYQEVIYMAPDGELLTQEISNELSLKKNLILLCGHYKGVDERVRAHLVTKEISIGNYVLSGGEIPACVLVDSIVRLIPGVLHDEVSVLDDSFQNGLVAPPVYSKPRVYKGWEVPDVLLSGDKNKIDEWMINKSIERTKERRPEMNLYL